MLTVKIDLTHAPPRRSAAREIDNNTRVDG